MIMMDGTTRTVVSNYDKLMEKAKGIIVLESARSLMLWDMETKMPPKGITLRSEQLALLKQFEHRMCIDPEIGALLQEIQAQPGYEALTKLQKKNLSLLRKKYDEMTKLPEELVVETAKQRVIAYNTWKKAKVAKDFSLFEPELEKLVNLRRRAAEILMNAKGTATPYDALIDIFEPKMPADEIAKIFDELKKGLVAIVEKCRIAPKQPDVSILKRKVPIDAQREISNSLAKFIKYDVDSKEAGGRIDETEHPFTSGYYDDVRITTHYYENNFTSSMFSILHEAGHAIYDQNLNSEWMYQPIGEGCSYGFHESQSRFVENMIGRSLEFWVYYLPKLKELAGNTFSDVELDTFVRAINQVEPSKIRVEADEVTYCLHVIIRFEIERELIAGKIAVADLPKIWNQKYEDYLGINIENDSEGVMQDVHWAQGYFGYFPTYALGNIYSGQILVALEKDIPDWKGQIKKGSFHKVKQWLANNVHQHGKLYSPLDLLRKITGEEINVKHYLDYLNEKYAKLYGFNQRH
ncbi:MAG: carboxypeptidase M32 [Candidatus Bathyarchaeota archaeon]|nr:MAG: carboxypeptidase M32 [Candidatus Bathyarchaeota archaeon]